jgi:carbon-monoxide dehydrogenase small subunit
MSSLALLEGTDDPDRDQIRHALEGNLCRCTGYQNIVDAVESAAGKLDATATDGGQDVE